jgi:hypothetical protein
VESDFRIDAAGSQKRNHRRYKYGSDEIERYIASKGFPQ